MAIWGVNQWMVCVYPKKKIRLFGCQKLSKFTHYSLIMCLLMIVLMPCLNSLLKIKWGCREVHMHCHHPGVKMPEKPIAVRGLLRTKEVQWIWNDAPLNSRESKHLAPQTKPQALDFRLLNMSSRQYHRASFSYYFPGFTPILTDPWRILRHYSELYLHPRHTLPDPNAVCETSLPTMLRKCASFGLEEWFPINTMSLLPNHQGILA